MRRIIGPPDIVFWAPFGANSARCMGRLNYLRLAIGRSFIQHMMQLRVPNYQEFARAEILSCEIWTAIVESSTLNGFSKQDDHRSWIFHSVCDKSRMHLLRIDGVWEAGLMAGSILSHISIVT